MIKTLRNLGNLRNNKSIVTVALNGILTDPTKFDVPVTPEELAQEALESFNAGATIAHVHFRNQSNGQIPTWDPSLAKDVANAIRYKVPDMILNFTTGTVGVSGPFGGGVLGPIRGPLVCIENGKPEIAALNCGSLNYLKILGNGEWAWKPYLFDNPVEKIEKMIEGMTRLGVIPECECFDTGIVRSIKMFEKKGILKPPYIISLVMGVSSGMSSNPKWLPLLLEELPEDAIWQTIAVGKENIWDLQRKSVELCGNVRTGLEDTFYLPDGSKTNSNGKLIEALVKIVREIGKEPTTPKETRKILNIGE